MIQRTYSVPALLIAASMVIVACSSSSSDDGTSDEISDPMENMQTSNPLGGGSNPGDADVSASFDGTWAEGCVSDGDPNFPSQFDEFTFTTATIADGIITTDVFSYTDAACTFPSLPAVTRRTASFVFTGDTTTTPRGEALHVDITLETIEFDGEQPAEEELATLTSLGTFDVQYDLIIESNGALFIGNFTEELDGTTPAKRPVTLETSAFLVRQ